MTIKKHIEALNNKRDKFEGRCITYKGVKNLSPADVDTIILYLRIWDEDKNWDGLMKPLGDLKKVLDAMM